MLGGIICSPSRLLAFSNGVSCSCGQAKTVRQGYRVNGHIFENGEKYLRFQAKTNTCGQGLNQTSTDLIKVKENIQNINSCFLTLKGLFLKNIRTAQSLYCQNGWTVAFGGKNRNKWHQTLSCTSFPILKRGCFYRFCIAKFDAVRTVIEKKFIADLDVTLFYVTKI